MGFLAESSKLVLRTDRDTVSDWYDKREAEIACCIELGRWAEHRVVRDGEVEISEDMTRVLFGSAVVEDARCSRL